MTNDLFMEDMPYVNLFSGRFKADYGDDIGAAVIALYTPLETFSSCVAAISEELGGSEADAFRETGIVAALYFAAAEYSDAHSESVDRLFPAIQRDFDCLGLFLGQYDNAHEAYETYKESKFYGKYGGDAPSHIPEDTIFVHKMISSIPSVGPTDEYQLSESEADKELDALRADLELNMDEFDYEELREI